MVEADDEAIPRAAFYCVSSAEYFLGAVAMINSLRLVGHEEPVLVLDAGLHGWQRALLEGEAEVVGAPPGRPPFTLKPTLPLARPARTMVLIDTDMIVTRSLSPLIERASSGAVVAFRNHAGRFVAKWSRVLGLGPMREQPYLCSGFVALGGADAPVMLARLESGQERVDFSRSYFGHHDDSYELLYADQDILNAILASVVEAERVVALDYRLAPMVPFEGLEVLDEGSLRCAYADGTEPYLIHHSLSPKPWQHPAYDGVYPRLLRRLLNGGDVAIRVTSQRIPRDLRNGPVGALERRLTKARAQVRWRLGAAPDGLAAKDRRAS